MAIETDSVFFFLVFFGGFCFVLFLVLVLVPVSVCLVNLILDVSGGLGWDATVCTSESMGIPINLAVDDRVD